MFNFYNIKKNVVKTIMPNSAEDGIAKFAVAGGLVFTVYIWNQYTDPALKYVSNNANKLIQYSDYIPNSIKPYFTASSLVGVTLASQVFIKSKSSHPPVVDFAKNTLLGLGYYIPFSIVSEVTKSLVFAKTDNLYSWACHWVAGLVAGGVAGSFIEANTAKSLDKVAQVFNSAYYSSMLLTTMVTSSLFGKAKATELDKESDMNHKNQEYNVDQMGLCGESEDIA